MRDRAAAWVLCAALAPAAAQTADPALDRRVERVTAELRCLVCQNQTIADSHAELALMLKRQVRDMLAHGASDQQAVDFMVQRYGDFVLYRPPVKAATWLLWFGPFGLLLGGLALLFARLRARLREPDDDAFNEEFPA
jgi:cytochrome c-type biogenesis protein CcmH